LEGSFLGQRARVQGYGAGHPPVKLNIGDDSFVSLKAG